MEMLAQVPEPAWFKPADEQLFMTNATTRRSLPNPAFLREHFLREGRLTEAQAVHIVNEATRVLTAEPNMLELQGPISGKHAFLYEITYIRREEVTRYTFSVI